jgi:3-mercaptopyruvate sulfurtransferase SseA
MSTVVRPLRRRSVSGAITVPEPTIRRISVTALRALLDDPGLSVWLIHAADQVAFREAHIPGALACPQDTLLRRLAGDVPVVVYGEDDQAEAAPALTAVLRHLDVEVVWFPGGLAAWRAAGLPVERSG